MAELKVLNIPKESRENSHQDTIDSNLVVNPQSAIVGDHGNVSSEITFRFLDTPYNRARVKESFEQHFNRTMPNGTFMNGGREESRYSSNTMYTKANYDITKAQVDLAQTHKLIAKLQMAIDLTNLTNMIEC